jgi:hypothetical protein
MGEWNKLGAGIINQLLERMLTQNNYLISFDTISINGALPSSFYVLK